MMMISTAGVTAADDMLLPLRLLHVECMEDGHDEAEDEKGERTHEQYQRDDGQSQRRRTSIRVENA